MGSGREEKAGLPRRNKHPPDVLIGMHAKGLQERWESGSEIRSHPDKKKSWRISEYF